MQMTSLCYDWNRYWCARNENFSLDNDGYVVPPFVGSYLMVNVSLKKYEQVSETPCLVLLGEPGSGKSHEMRNIVKAAKLNTAVMCVDLRTVMSDTMLYRKIFEASDFLQWQEGSGVLDLFLDSFDECRLRVSTVAAILAEELASKPVQRLRLRIACRTAEWSKLLEDACRLMWEKESTAVYELIPLLRDDIVTAATSQGVDAEDFLSEIARVRGAGFASRPVTLATLLRLYKENNGNLPTSQYELYEQGCLSLCIEHNESRADAKDIRTTDAKQRLAVAARLAAVTQIGNYPLIFTGTGIAPEGSVSIAELSGGTEAVNGGDFFVTEQVLRETLDTGLFSARGSEPGIMGWGHLTYAEFLSAHYLHDRQVDARRYMPLITSTFASTNDLVPQLRETAAWLAVVNQDARERLMEADPLLLLKSDVMAINPALADKLVPRLMQWMRDKKARPQDLEYSGLLPRIGAHTDLSGVIGGILRDKTEDENARYLAVVIAGECRISTLAADLTRIALDSDEPLLLRKRLVRSSVRLGG